jgi:hypothetical protein
VSGHPNFTNVSEDPNLVRMNSWMNFVVTIVVIVQSALTSTHLVTWLVTTKMYLFLIYQPIGLMGPIKFNPHFMKGLRIA